MTFSRSEKQLLGARPTLSSFVGRVALSPSPLSPPPRPARYQPSTSTPDHSRKSPKTRRLLWPPPAMNLSSPINSFVFTRRLYASTTARSARASRRAAPRRSPSAPRRAFNAPTPAALNFNFISSPPTGGARVDVKESNLAWNLRPVTGGGRLGVPGGRPVRGRAGTPTPPRRRPLPYFRRRRIILL